MTYIVFSGTLNPTHLHFTSLVALCEGLNEVTAAVGLFKQVLHQDNMCVEAIACIATHHFYTDQPEVALNYFR